MRNQGEVYDALYQRGQIVIHASEVERTAALARLGSADDLVGATPVSAPASVIVWLPAVMSAISVSRIARL